MWLHVCVNVCGGKGTLDALSGAVHLSVSGTVFLVGMELVAFARWADQQT